LGGLADLICDLGANLVIEQMLEREPGAGEIEENLIEAWVLVGFVDRPAETRATISTEGARRVLRGSICAAQFLCPARFSRSVPTASAPGGRYMESPASCCSSFLRGVHAVHFNESGGLS